MYSRYIPPPKAPQNASEASPAHLITDPAESRAASKATTNVNGSHDPVDGYSYARYVPGLKNTHTAEVKKGSLQFFDDEPSSPKPKRKRESADGTETPLPERRKSKKSKASPHTKEKPEELAGGVKSVSKQKKERSQRDDKIDRDVENEPSKDHTVKDAESPSRKDTAMEKKERRKKTKKLKNTVDVDDNNHDERTTGVDALDVVHDKPQPNGITDGSETKNKREKRKEKVKKESLLNDEGGHSDNDMRHKAVLNRKTKSLNLASKAAMKLGEEPELEAHELHGLEPLPQPEPAAVDDSAPTYDTLPPWLSAPIRVSQDTTASFTDLGILPKATRVLQERGYPQAFAVQTAAIPLLMPTAKRRSGDVLISAATGSGKTLAYALPITRDISQGVVTRLRALVVLPTRELVKQAQEVFEVCAKAFEGIDRKRVRVGIAIGSQSIKMEQDVLVDRESRYDPEAYGDIHKETRRGKTDTNDIDALWEADPAAADPRLGQWDGEVVDFYSKVDVLICTPGRLVEHLEQTPGFTLDYVRWLVVDEADKLLAQSFQGWLDTVNEKFRVEKLGARDFPDMYYSGVRKVVLSATLTRDLSLLDQLALRRPQLIVLDSEGDVQVAEHTTPAALKEFAIRVHDQNLKPLYLLDLLRSDDMKTVVQSIKVDGATEEQADDASDTSEPSSESSSDSETSSSDSSSDSDSDSDTKSAKPIAPQWQIPISLIFTKSNESALRLSRLLTLLDSSLTPHVSTLTSTTPTHIRRKTLRTFTTPNSPIRLIIASDLVARGIDIPRLANVINYDLPASVAGYIHRVGRTARAGRFGSAWTLVGDEESGWFWGKIAKSTKVRRSQKVERVRIDEMTEERVEVYENSLAQLGQEASERRIK